jgi:hypothetical protein
MPDAKVTKAGNAPIKKLGHTVGTKYGTNPLAKERGPSNPTEISFGSKG